ncbi:hypothetical protein Nepgr_019021 [Nepenthes gracilis]|uniref:RING-type E3 ubiquitin transferase n=1 Tax=Nepenthes gracilis TaxID=150966 RepID=A0AAD3SSS7_NEPGR|nr:hypothetical protein Nepgr_019021 [Nepenthes gracilis]
MATVGAPQPWPSSSSSSSTPANFNDCSPGICTIYCFQRCHHYLIPPRPFGTFTDADASDSGSGISPLMVALISVLASAFLLLTYYTVISKYCKRRRSRSRDPEEFHIAGEDLEARLDQLIREPTNSQQASSAGLDERLIKSITVFKYRRGTD